MCKNKGTTIKSGDHTTITQSANGDNKVSHIESEYKFAFEIKNSARTMGKLAKEANNSTEPDNYWKQKSFIHASIILSYTYLEAALNEVTHLLVSEEKSNLSEIEIAILSTIVNENLVSKNNSNTLQKFNMLLRILGKRELKTNCSVYQNANLVRKLRNMIIHPIPGRVVTFTEEKFDYSKQQEIVKKLRSCLKLPSTATFPKEVLTAKCANWAISSCETFLDDFKKNSGIDIGFVTET